MTTAQLVDRFVEIALKQDRTLFTLDTAKYNKLYDQMEAVEKILKSRPSDDRCALISLYSHQNDTVRVKAAQRTLVLEPEAARKVLQDVWNSRASIAAPLAGLRCLL